MAYSKDNPWIKEREIALCIWKVDQDRGFISNMNPSLYCDFMSYSQRQIADYVQMINSHLLSLCFLHRPKDKALMGILAQMLADETERLVTERIKVNSLFDEIKRKLDILLEEG